MKRKLLSLACAAALALSVSGCTQNVSQVTGSAAPSGQATDPAANVLRLGVMYSTDIVPLAVMKDQSLDEQFGFTLDMQVFQSAKDRDAALQAGELDGVFTDYIGVCIYQNAGLDVKITGVTDGDYVLLSAPGSAVTALDEAEGSSIAISENTLIEYTLDYLLSKAEYDESFVQKEIVPRIPDRLEMLRAGQTPIGLLPDPFGSLALESGCTRLGSANDAGLYPAVMGFLQSSIDGKKDILKNFYLAYNAAVDYVNSAPISEFEDVIITGAGFPEELRGKITLPVFRKDVMPTAEELQAAIDWASGRGLCGKSLQPRFMVSNINS